MGAIDQAIFRAVNGWPDSVAPIFVFFSEATKAPYRVVVVPLLLILVVAMLVRGGRSREAAILALLAVLLSNGLTEALKTAIAMPRPCNDLPNVVLHVGRLTTFGTASSHAANMAAVATVFTALLGRWGWPWIGVAVLTALSRVYVGVHYPSQVVLGALCGIFCAFLLMQTWAAYLRLRNQLRTASVDAVQDVDAAP